MPLLPSRNCIFRANDKCLNSHYGGSASDERCAICLGYAGKARGMGDIMHNVLATVGIPKLVERAIGDCGCAERRAAMNRAMPFADKLETEKQ